MADFLFSNGLLRFAAQTSTPPETLLNGHHAWWVGLLCDVSDDIGRPYLLPVCHEAGVQ